ncbi:MAG: transcription-repair coupling factor [Thermodesulfovibrionales bacterium]
MSDVTPIVNLIKQEVETLLEEVSSTDTKDISNVSVPHAALILNYIRAPFIFIEEKDKDADALYRDFQCLYRIVKGQNSVVFLPPPLNMDLIALRNESLRDFMLNQDTSIITSLPAITSFTEILNIDNDVLNINIGDVLERGSLKEWLFSKGYKEVSMVIDKGEFSHRGYIFDVFSPLMEEPLRIEFFGDDIEDIKIFDVETQRSKKQVRSARIHSTVETSSSHDMLSQLLSYKDSILYASANLTGVDSGSFDSVAIFFHHKPVSLVGISTKETGFAGLGILPNERRSWDDLTRFFREASKPIITILPSRGQAERLKDILYDAGVVVPIIDIEHICQYDGNHCITVGELSQGFCLNDVMFLSGKEIFGERLLPKSSRRQRLSRILINLEDLRQGDLVVHKEHGIGRFEGIDTISIDNNRCDLINIQYANGRLQMPVQDIHLINKYSAGDSSIPVLDSLGSQRWQRAKIKARISAEELAQRLVNLYAERSVNEGFAFSEDTYIHREFDEFFVYQETHDQLKAIEDIKIAMQSPKPMDMLLCGDVGYGKTEVVMRAIFRAVYDKKQVAVLVPTTILAEQHFKTFKARFQGFSVNIEVINRFKPPSERARILKRLARHEIDVIIGTHGLLRKDISFADLGLLVIDEEHKFGVQQKERLKELRKGVDVITLTATPIPRTLQMSLSGIREMTMIETPPEDRVSVKTFVVTFHKTIIKEAIQRELSRNGQVYYVYNRINMLDEKALIIKELFPTAKVEIAHGEMKEESLERIMFDFMDGKIDILVCTAIIGSGLDIPSVNTIIIDRADMFGLADLYQLRGRVGRSNLQAYAYMLIPESERLNEDAIKRLQAIQEMTYLGAGFKIALKDLEIRGAGNILGREQSGHIHRVGFDMYMELLDEAVANIKGETAIKRFDIDINLKITALIPDTYIQDVTIRLSIYRRLAECKTIEEIAELTNEIIDRFGEMPEETRNLIKILRLKHLCRMLYIYKIVEGKEDYSFYVVSMSEQDDDMLKSYHMRLIDMLNKIRKQTKAIIFFHDGFRLQKKAAGLDILEDFLTSIYKEAFRRENE